MEQSWWNPALNALAQQLSKGALNEMKRRILGTNIKKEKLQLDEDTQRMREFFAREIQRHNKRKQQLKQRQNKLYSITKQLQEVQQQLTKKENELRQKEKLFNKKERQYKKVIEQQMRYLQHLKPTNHSNP